MSNLMKAILGWLFSTLALTAVGQGSSDLILTGSNSWIFHTPDDGRTNLHIAPYINGDWKWGMVYLENNGLLVAEGLSTKALAVKGNIRAKEIKVETSNWPDYVFKPKYKLLTLAETERFINENGHLPDVPKAEVVENEGYSLDEMDKILLKKIEELTLQLIEKDKMLQDLVKRMNKLESH
ncbi:hypothetical protein D3C87_739800 [compost metagenome]